MAAHEASLDYTLLTSLLITGGILVVIVYELLLLSDFESEDINSIDFCRKMNKLILPEYYAHFAQTALFLLGFKWILLLINLPLAIYHAHSIFTFKYRLDPTKIFTVVGFVGNFVLGKLVYFMIMFFLYLFLLLYNLFDG